MDGDAVKARTIQALFGYVFERTEIVHKVPGDSDANAIPRIAGIVSNALTGPQGMYFGLIPKAPSTGKGLAGSHPLLRIKNQRIHLPSSIAELHYRAPLPSSTAVTTA